MEVLVEMEALVERIVAVPQTHIPLIIEPLIEEMALVVQMELPSQVAQPADLAVMVRLAIMGHVQEIMAVRLHQMEQEGQLALRVQLVLPLFIFYRVLGLMGHLG